MGSNQYSGITTFHYTTLQQKLENTCRASKTGYNNTISKENTVNISCLGSSKIQIQDILVHEEETTCRLKPCELNSNDTQTVEDNCNGENSCLVDNNFTSACLREFGYMNISYTCKHENRTSVSTFEKDFGDWMVVLSNNTTWKRQALVKDHTRVHSDTNGYSIDAVSFVGKAGTTRIGTDNEFMEPICLSIWFQFWIHTYNLSFNVYKLSGGNGALLYTVNGNSALFNRWVSISVDVYHVYGQDPFKIALEADFEQSNSNAARAILIDDISIAYRPCQGITIYRPCQGITITNGNHEKHLK
ncbi:unnamed protein product [Mytilus edulis]|uniref:MAM domain-containing protein n=1 Tax=Mytilus edulis TaxID=6550 RepID=A0A8S3U2Y5_MYTED|nr:unnamed protein product [Mytilus edulis]